MMDLADIIGGGSGGYISHASARPQPSEEARRAAALAAAEKRAKSQALRCVSGRTPTLFGHHVTRACMPPPAPGGIREPLAEYEIIARMCRQGEGGAGGCCRGTGAWPERGV